MNVHWGERSSETPLTTTRQTIGDGTPAAAAEVAAAPIQEQWKRARREPEAAIAFEITDVAVYSKTRRKPLNANRMAA